MLAESEQYDFNSVLAELDTLGGWLESLGFSKNDRVRRYRSCIARVIEAHQTGSLKNFTHQRLV